MPNRHKRRMSKVTFMREQKEVAVMDFLSRDARAQDTADQRGVSRATLYIWSRDLLGKDDSMRKQPHSKPKPSENKDALQSKVKSLEQQLETLEQQIYRLKLERDVLKATAE